VNFDGFSKQGGEMKTLILLIGTLLILCITNALAQKVSLQVRKQIVQQMVSDSEIEASCIRQEGASRVVSVSTLQLNRDSKPAFLVIGSGCGCQGARRCMQWVYRQNGNGYEKIFDAYPAESITPKRAFTKGYRDLVAAGWSGNDLCTITYKFNGTRYKEVENSLRCESVR
jgi:hypothetical protein